VVPNGSAGQGIYEKICVRTITNIKSICATIPSGLDKDMNLYNLAVCWDNNTHIGRGRSLSDRSTLRHNNRTNIGNISANSRSSRILYRSSLDRSTKSCITHFESPHYTQFA
jgi:hypothetical protein